METEDYATLTAMLEWQIDLGVTEAIGDLPVNRYELTEAAQAAKPAPAAVLPEADPAAAEPATVAERMAGAAADLAALKAAVAAFDGCELKKGARALVFGGGNPAARVMVIGGAPGRDEEQAGVPFAGPAGQMLDRMFAAIGLSRRADEARQSVYLTGILPWRTPTDREPTDAEVAMMLPFMVRHVALVDPAVVVVMGDAALFALLGLRGITRARGEWGQAMGRAVLPMLHPAHLLRFPEAKREAWADLLDLQERIRG